MQTGWQIHLTDDERSRLRPVGYWLSPEQPALPDPALHVDTTWDEEERRATLAYLGSAPACMRFYGYSTCRLCGCSGPELGDSDRNDGTWLWPEGLPHYLDHHGVRPPEPFLVHLRTTRFGLQNPLIPIETALARMDSRLVCGMVCSEEERLIQFRLSRSATPKDLYLGGEIDRALSFFRLEVNEAALAAERRKTERLLNPPAWQGLVRVLLGV